MSSPPPPGDVTLSVQRRYAPGLQCFGCGPANPQGLHLESFEQGDGLVAHFKPQPHHLAFPGVVNGGIIGALLDCHSNWAATIALKQARGLDHPPSTVTADFHVKMRKPTPLDSVLDLEARAVSIEGDKVTVEATLAAGGVVTATCRGTFVAVKPGHPAHHRW